MAFASADNPGEFGALRSLLAAQDAAVAAAAHDTIVRTLEDLLSTLIGASLTQRLLGASANPSSVGSAAQDNPLS